MALIQASLLSSVVAPQLYDASGSVVSAPPNPDDAVQLALSSGQAVTVFDSVTTALKLLKYMWTQNQWLIQLPKVFVVSVSHAKLLLLEATVANQKLIQTFAAPLYEHGQVRFAARSSYDTHDLQSALQSVGSLQMSVLNDNVDLASVNIQVVDYNYKASPSAGEGSLLLDAVPLRYKLQ
jgi:hypothetical protein